VKQFNAPEFEHPTFDFGAMQVFTCPAQVAGGFLVTIN
jgi:hypothetical protein